MLLCHLCSSVFAFLLSDIWGHISFIFMFLQYDWKKNVTSVKEEKRTPSVSDITFAQQTSLKWQHFQNMIFYSMPLSSHPFSMCVHWRLQISTSHFHLLNIVYLYLLNIRVSFKHVSLNYSNFRPCQYAEYGRLVQKSNYEQVSFLRAKDASKGQSVEDGTGRD